MLTRRRVSCGLVAGLCVLMLGISAAAATSAAAQDPEIGLEMVAEGFASPVVAIEPPDETNRLFIVDQTGQTWVVGSDGEVGQDPFLDVSDRMVSLNDSFDERGLLGLAFHSNYSENGRLFVYYSAPLRDEGPDGWNHTSRVSEFTASSTDPDLADAESERILLEIDQPQGNHNAGAIAFGPDNLLYIALGDGGGADDTGMGHVADWYAENAGGNGQDITTNLLGSILRIDVDGDSPYGIPADNPFVEGDGLDEIYAYGLRNPYRMSFDMGGDNVLLVGDAGQSRWEEVSAIERGGNYGWNVYEGAHCFDAADSDANPTDCPTTVGTGHPDEGAPMLNPVIEYENGAVGIAVVGGFVYRGSMLPDFEGRYIFGDWSTSFGSPNGVLFVATPADEGMWPFEELSVVENEFQHFLVGFGQDLDGEVYVLTSDTPGPSGDTGIVYRVIPAAGTAAEGPDETPASFSLSQNYPNPFNPSTQIRYDLRHVGTASIQIFDVLGREVATLADGPHAAGVHAVEWNGTDASGETVPSGVYVYQLRTEAGVVSRTMTLIR